MSLSVLLFTSSAVLHPTASGFIRRAPAPLLVVDTAPAALSADPDEPPPDPAPIAMWQAVGALNAATLIWGSQHALIKDVVADASPSSVNAARFCIAAVASLPFLPSLQNTSTWKAGFELGRWSFLGFALQAIGLQYTDATSSAFLLYLNVKLVPILALLLYGRQSPLRTWISAVLAFGGTALLSYDGAPPNIGDAWCIAAALASACFILRLEEAAKCGAPAKELNAATITSTALLTTLWALCELFVVPGGGGAERASELVSILSERAAPLFYLALVTTATAQWLQTIGQSRVNAQDAAVIYALDPVYAAGFSWLLLGEQLGPQGYAGVAVVLGAVFLSRAPRAAAGYAEESEAKAD